MTAPASDRIHLGGLNGDIGPDGRPEAAGDGFPARALKRHSLIFRIGNGRWRQGGSPPPPGSTPVPAIAEVDGVVIIHINDDLLADNTGGWNVTVTRTAWMDFNDLPRPASSALLQSVDGNLRPVVTYNRGSSPYVSNLPGNVMSYQRDRSFAWTHTGPVTDLRHDSVSSYRRETAYLYPSWFQGTDGRLWGVCVQGAQVMYFAHGAPPVAVPGADDCVGPPSMIQSSEGNRGDFKLVYPARGGQMKFRSADNSVADNSGRSCDMLHASLTWDAGAPPYDSVELRGAPQQLRGGGGNW